MVARAVVGALRSHLQANKSIQEKTNASECQRNAFQLACVTVITMEDA